MRVCVCFEKAMCYFYRKFYKVVLRFMEDFENDDMADKWGKHGRKLASLVDVSVHTGLPRWLSGIPTPGGLPNPGIKLGSPSLQADSLPTDLSLHLKL